MIISIIIEAETSPYRDSFVLERMKICYPLY
jgi:hypothetical protein